MKSHTVFAIRIKDLTKQALCYFIRGVRLRSSDFSYATLARTSSSLKRHWGNVMIVDDQIRRTEKFSMESKDSPSFDFKL